MHSIALESSLIIHTLRSAIPKLSSSLSSTHSALAFLTMYLSRTPPNRYRAGLFWKKLPINKSATFPQPDGRMKSATKRRLGLIIRGQNRSRSDGASVGNGNGQRTSLCSHTLPWLVPFGVVLSLLRIFPSVSKKAWAGRTKSSQIYRFSATEAVYDGCAVPVAVRRMGPRRIFWH